jgi:hypothetical protein
LNLSLFRKSGIIIGPGYSTLLSRWPRPRRTIIKWSMETLLRAFRLCAYIHLIIIIVIGACSKYRCNYRWQFSRNALFWLVNSSTAVRPIFACGNIGHERTKIARICWSDHSQAKPNCSARFALSANGICVSRRAIRRIIIHRVKYVSALTLKTVVFWHWQIGFPNG